MDNWQSNLFVWPRANSTCQSESTVVVHFNIICWASDSVAIRASLAKTWLSLKFAAQLLWERTRCRPDSFSDLSIVKAIYPVEWRSVTFVRDADMKTETCIYVDTQNRVILELSEIARYYICVNPAELCILSRARSFICRARMCQINARSNNENRSIIRCASIKRYKKENKNISVLFQRRYTTQFAAAN